MVLAAIRALLGMGTVGCRVSFRKYHKGGQNTT